VEALALEGTGGSLATVGMETADSTLGLLEEGAEGLGDWDGVGTGDGFALALGPTSPTSEA